MSCRKSSDDEKERSRNPKKEISAPGLGQENLREQRGYPEGRWETIEGRSNSKGMQQARATEEGKKRKGLTWRTKSETMRTSFEVGYVPSSLPDHRRFEF